MTGPACARFIGSSPAIRQLEREIGLASRCDSKILITGESGSGKEVAARLIHEGSSRRNARFCAINCAGLTDSLLESELFGHERGSFTGAYRDKPGLLELANQGTLFMDEVCEMSLRMQILLLRFLDTGEIQRVGSEKPDRRLDVRIIAATNRDVEARIASGEFRQDLYFRLNVLQIHVPPLRDRAEDLTALLGQFLHCYAQQRGIPAPELGAGVLERLMSYEWPGNVRELRNLVERVVLRLDGTTIELDDLPAQLNRAWRSQSTEAPSEVPALERTLVARMVNERQCFWSVVHQPFMDRDLTRANVREVVRLGLEQCQGSYARLAQTFNMQAADYKRFMSFLRSYHCHIPLQGFRVGPSPAPPSLTEHRSGRDTSAVS